MNNSNTLNKYLIVSPCGNRSRLFKDLWMKDYERKNFDICLLFYDEEIHDNSLYKDINYFYHLKGFKYEMAYDVFMNIKPEILDKYEHFYFLDDDISIDTESINKLFDLHNAFRSYLSQASLTKDSFCSWEIFKTDKSAFCRYAGQIEVMSPMFSKEALKICLPSFISNKSSWGMDSVWAKLLGYPKDRFIIFDCIQMKHTEPVGAGALYKRIKVAPHTDWENITNEFGAKKQNYREYGRLSIVNQNKNKFIYFKVKVGELFSTIKRSIKDYDATSRINNQLKLIRHKNL